MGCIIYRLIEGIHHENANIRCDTIMFSERDLPFQRFTRDVIELVTRIAHAKHPTLAGAPVLLRMVLVHVLMVL